MHIDTLANLIRLGGMVFGIAQTDGSELLVRWSVKGQDLSATFADAIARGNKATFYRAHLALLYNRMHSFNGGGQEGVVRSWVIGLPAMDGLLPALERMPFAEHLEVARSIDPRRYHG